MKTAKHCIHEIDDRCIDCSLNCPNSETFGQEESEEANVGENNQSEVKAGTPLADPTGSRNCSDCERTSGRQPGLVFCALYDKWVNAHDVECVNFCGANTGDKAL